MPLLGLENLRGLTAAFCSEVLAPYLATRSEDEQLIILGLGVELGATDGLRIAPKRQFISLRKSSPRHDLDQYRDITEAHVALLFTNHARGASYAVELVAVMASKGFIVACPEMTRHLEKNSLLLPIGIGEHRNNVYTIRRCGEIVASESTLYIFQKL